jgi:hypothetical protein
MTSNKKELTENENESVNKSESANKNESANEESMVSSEQTMTHIIKKFYYITIGLMISIFVFYKLRSKKMNNMKRTIYVLMPLLFSIIIFVLMNSPKPVGQYYVSLLYSDEPVKTNYKQNNKGEWPFIGSTTIKINGTNHLFVGNLNNGNDALLLFNEKTKQFDDVIDKTNIDSSSKTYSAVAYDINGDDKDDLIIGRDNGVYIYLNDGGYTIFKK